MRLYKYAVMAVAAIGCVGCQENDPEISAPLLAPVDEASITGQLEGNDYVWTWGAAPGLDMQVSVYAGTSLSASETVSGNTYTHRNIDTNIDYTYVFKRTDGQAFSSGVVKHYTRPGASMVSGVAMSQVDRDGGYDVRIEWNAPADAEEVRLTATNGNRSVTEVFRNAENSYLIPGVNYGEEWAVTIVAANAMGNSLPATSSLKIGKTAVGFLSVYQTEEELLRMGDDDEASAWLWLKSEYPSASYVYFGDITSENDIEPYRVLFWLRDLEGVDEGAVWSYPAVVENATPYIAQWYKAGGNLLLWSHATAYIAKLGRIQEEMLRTNDRSIACGVGGWNGDTWVLAVQLHPGSKFKKDMSSHPIYKGLEVTETDRTKLITFKGPGWTEDHNCLYFNIPSVLTGIGNQEEACYNAVTEQYGIYPLGTWDSQFDWVSQLNVWEAQQGNTDYTGTVLCIGNGGCEFSLRNADGSPDVSAYPSNNIYQANVLTLARNSIEYLKAR